MAKHAAPGSGAAGRTAWSVGCVLGAGLGYLVARRFELTGLAWGVVVVAAGLVLGRASELAAAEAAAAEAAAAETAAAEAAAAEAAAAEAAAAEAAAAERS